jgi:hypothetical protein
MDLFCVYLGACKVRKGSMTQQHRLTLLLLDGSLTVAAVTRARQHLVTERPLCAMPFLHVCLL